MAIKVYKGGSWVNATGVSAIGKADRLAIGQTNTSLPESDKLYYLSFVDDNHPYTSRQYEDFYTGIGLTFSPISQSLGVGGVLYLSGQQNNFQGSIRSYGGADKLFVIYNESAEGVIAINPANSAGLNDVGIATFKRGVAAANDDSYFRSNVSPTKDCSGIYNLGKPNEEWNNVYANCFHGDGTGLTGTGSWDDDDYKNLKAGTCAGNAITAETCYNIFVGAYAGCLTTGSSGAGGADQVADSNVFLGASAGRHNVTGSYNFYGGYLAGRGKVSSSPSGSCNIFIGRSAGQEITSGTKNVFLGPLAGEAMETGDNNIFLGLSAGRYASSASQSVAIGLGAGYCNITANFNTFLGTYAGRNVSSGGSNVAIGMNALRGQQAASGQPSCDILGIQNVAVGYAAGKSIGPLAADQGANTFLGAQAACTQLDGSFNVAIGYQVQLDLTSCTNVACVSNQLAIGAGSNRWLTGDKSFNIKPGKGIIDCTGSCGTEGQVLTSHKVAGTPDDYYVKWNTNVSTATKADQIQITDDIDADDNSQIHYIHFGEKTSDYDSVKVDSNGLSYYQARDDEKWVGIGTTSPHDSTGNASGLTLSRGDGQVRLIMKNNDTGHSDGDGSHIVIGSKDFTFENRTSEGHLHWSTNIAATGATADIGKRMTLTPEGHVGIGTTNPIADNITTALDDNDKVLAVGIVTAKEYYGTFKGTIDPGATITLDKIEEGNTSAEVVDGGTDGYFKVLTEGTERLRIGDSGISTFSSDKALVARFERLGNTGGEWAKVDIKANSTSGNSYLTFSDSAATEVGAINYEHNDDSLRFEVWDRTNSTPSRKSRLRIGNLGQIGLYDGTSGGSGTSDSFGTNDQVLTSKGPNATPVWQDLGGIPASEANQLKITKTASKTELYLLGVENVSGEDTADGNITTKTVYQKTQNTLFFNTSTDTLRVPKIRGELIAGGSWPALQGNLTIQTNHLIPSSNVTINSQGIVIDPLEITNVGSGYGNGYVTNVPTSGGTGTNLTVNTTTGGGILLNIAVNSGGTGYVVGDTVSVNLNGNTSATFKITAIDTTITGGQNLGSATKKWAEVYAQKFVGHLGGTADSTKQIEVQKNEDAGNAHYFGMVSVAGEKGFPINQTVYTDTSLYYIPSTDILTASKINVDTKLHVKGNTELGDQLSDTVTWTGRSGTIQPSGTPDTDGYTDKNLGSTTYKWNNVYAKTFDGAFQGTATNTNNVQVSGSNQNKDFSLTFIEWASGDDDPSYEGLKFDPDRNLTYNAASNVLTVPNLAISGITTLGDALNNDKTIFKSKVDSNIVPVAPASGDAADRHDIGSPNDKWGIVYATEFSGTMSGSVAQVNTQSTTTIDGFVTFVENNNNNAAQSTVYTNSLLTYNSSANSEILTVGGQLKVSGNAEFEEDVILGSDTNDKVTFKSKIAAPMTLGIGQILPDSPANEAKTAGIDLGSTGAYWKTIYAREFKGAITGNADTATALDPGATINLTTGAYSTTVDFSSTATAAFTGSGAYTITSALNTTGVTAATYGSTTSIPQITVDAKGRITSASNKTIDLTGATADKAKQLQVTERDNSTIDYIPFVIGAPSGTATAKTFYSDDNLRYKSASDMLITSKISSDGSFPSAAGKIATTKQVGSNITWEWGEGTASGIGRNYTLPLTVSGSTATWTLTDNVPSPNTNTNPIALTAGTGLTISSSTPGTTGGSFTISMDTSSNTAFKYKNGSTDNGTGKVAATLQIYPSGTNPTIDATQIVTITPGTGIKFTSQSAQALTIESDSDLGASTVATTLATDDSAHYLTFVTGSTAGTSKTLYQDSNGLTYNPSSNTLTTQDLSVTGNTTLGNANTDTVSWSARSGTILPSGTSGSQDLGSSTYKWGTIHATTISGTLSVSTTDKQVLYTDTSSGSALVAGTDNFTWDMPSNASGVLKVSRNPDISDPANEDNWAAITTDGALEITRTHATTFNGQVYRGGAYIDFRDDPAYDTHDYIARMQVTTHMAGGLWNYNNDRGGILFETGGTGYRHMLLNKYGVLGITRGTSASAILTNDGTNHTSGFVPGRSRDASVGAGHHIDQKVVLDVNGTLMLRSNEADPNTATSSRLEGGQITLNNSEDTIAYSIDVYGTTANNSMLRIVDEKQTTDDDGNALGRGIQRVALSRTGAIGFGDVGNEDWGDVGDVLTSSGNGAKPYWHPSPGGVSGSKFRIYEANDTSTNSGAAWPPYYPTSTNSGGVYSTNVKFIMATAIGGGGGAGGIRGIYSNTENRPISGGGGGGGCATIIVPMSLMGFNTATGKCDKVWMQIGSGGAGGTGGGYNGQSANGSDGSHTYFRWNWTNAAVWGSEIVGMGGGGSQRVDLVYDGYSNNSAKRNTWAGFSVGGNGGKYRRSDYGGQSWENRWLAPSWVTRDVSSSQATTNYTGRSGERGHFTGNLHSSGQFLTSYAPINMRMKGGASGYGGHGPITSDVGFQLGTSDERKWMDWGVGGDGAITDGLGYNHPTSNMGYGDGQKGWFGAVIIQEFF